MKCLRIIPQPPSAWIKPQRLGRLDYYSHRLVFEVKWALVYMRCLCIGGVRRFML